MNSKKEALAAYDIVAKLSGLDRLAEINGLGRDDLSLFIAIAQRRDLWDALATDTSSSVDSDKHRRGAGASQHRRISSVSGHRPGLPGRIGDAADFVRKLESLAPGERQQRLERLRGNREVADRAREIAASLTFPLSTIHYSQVTVHKAEIDEELIEAYRGTVSLPFAPGEHKRIAVKIVDDRGIESLKVIEV